MTNEEAAKLHVALEEIARLGKQLGEKTDALNNELGTIETALEYVGVEAWVSFGPDFELLGWARDKGEGWCLVYCEKSETAEAAGPVLNAKRGVRVAAYRALPRLIDAMLTAVRAELARLVEVLG